MLQAWGKQTRVIAQQIGSIQLPTQFSSKNMCISHTSVQAVDAPASSSTDFTSWISSSWDSWPWVKMIVKIVSQLYKDLQATKNSFWPNNFKESQRVI